ncbi:MAG: MurR/RpiR family transcriptional regulator [Pseudomonadota bacterium]
MTTPDDLRTRLQGHHADLPPQLQIINRFVLDRPDRAALMTIAEISGEIGVQPSSVIRFSKAVGYQGFSEIQRILREALTLGTPSNYFDRLDRRNSDSSDVARFRTLAEASLADLPADADLNRAARLMAEARIIHVLGFRRAYGIAAYLTYLLSGFGAAVNQLAARGNMTEAMTSTVTPDDVLVALSFPNYTPQTIETVDLCRDRGVRHIAITDSVVSPIAPAARALLLTDRGDDAGFRSGVGALVTVQALAAGYGRLCQSKGHNG